MTERSTPAAARERRDRLHEQARNMVTHLRTQVLPVPGRRAAVRAALGQEPGEPRTFHAYREIAEFFPEPPRGSEEHAFLAVAAMLCAQPASNRKQEISAASDDVGESESDSDESVIEQNQPGWSLGATCAEAVNRGFITEKNLESRLHQLCRVDAHGVHRQLPRLTHHLRGVGVDIDWATLIEDLASWDSARQHIAARWLRDFYRKRTAKSTSAATKTDEQSQEQS